MLGQLGVEAGEGEGQAGGGIGGAGGFRSGFGPPGGVAFDKTPRMGDIQRIGRGRGGASRVGAGAGAWWHLARGEARIGGEGAAGGGWRGMVA